LLLCLVASSSRTDSCICRLLYDQLLMTSLCLPRIQATASLSPPLGAIPLQCPSHSTHHVENCSPWIQLYRRAAADLRNSVVDPRQLLLRLDTLPRPNADELDKVRVGHCFFLHKYVGKFTDARERFSEEFHRKTKVKTRLTHRPICTRNKHTDTQLTDGRC